MINDLLRNALYYIEIALAKPFYAIVPAVVTLLAGGYFIYTMPRTYQSEALMLLQFQQIPTSLVSPTVSNDRLQFVEQRVLSRKNLLALADKHLLFPDLAAVLPKAQFASLVRNQISLNIQFSDGPDRSASNGMIRIGFKYADPLVATEVVSDLVSQIVEENRRIRLTRASETTRFLTLEAERVAQQFREREAIWNKYIEENGTSHPTRIPALLLELQGKEQELALLDRAIVALNEDVRVYEAQLRMGAEQASQVTRLTSQLRDVESEIATKSLIYSDAHPQIRILKQRIDEIEAQITAARQDDAAGTPTNEIQPLTPELMLVAERIAGAKPRQEQSNNQRNELMQRINQLRTAISLAPEVGTQIAAHEAEKASLQRSMDEMQAKLDTARLGERLEVGDAALQIEVVEEPEVPKGPAGPRRAYLAVAVCLAAAGIGAASIYATHLLDRTIRGTFDLADLLAGETLAVIPHWTPTRHMAKAFRNAVTANSGPS
ncbi:GumC family protein [Rhizobium terrae]|uniref:GumC family protein n=1 Tax=Rhizobium terrae TaxID=2171756 RepID=UPI000E3E4A91|nr:hypothetical protein [Rhizobium terrae]